MTQELVIIDPKEYGLEEKQAEKMTSGLATVLTERKALEEIYNAVIVKELNAETFKEARELRLKVQKNRTTGIEAWHKTNKAFYLAGGRFVDAYKNKEVVINEQMEAKLLEIEKYEQKLEADRKAKLKADRLELLLPYEVDTEYVSIEEMTEEQFTGFLANNKLAFETKKENERLAELARIEAEKKAEAERLERERLEAERIEAQRLENERLKKEAEQREKAEIERVLKLEAKAEKHIKKLLKAGFELSNNDNYIDKLAHRYGKGDYSVSVGNLQNMTDEEVDLAISNVEKWIKEQKEAQEEKDRLAKIAADEKAKSDKLEAELKAKKDAEDLALANEKARIEAEENERKAKEQALANADDQTKFKDWFIKFDALIKQFPDLKSEAGLKMSARVKEALKINRALIVEDSKTLL